MTYPTTLRRLFCLMAALPACMHSGAVLIRRRILSPQLSVLRAELETSFIEQQQNMARYAVVQPPAAQSR